METVPIGPVVEAAAHAAAQTAAVIENADAQVDAVIEAANVRVAAAEENAERIAEAALEGERGRRIDEIQQELGTCRENNRILASDLQETRQQVTELSAQVQALLTLEIIAAAMSLPASSPALSSSTLPKSETLTEAAATAAETLDPSSLSAVVESPAVAIAPVRKKRVI